MNDYRVISAALGFVLIFSVLGGWLARLPDSKYRELVLRDMKPSAVIRRSNSAEIRRLEPKSFGFFFGTRPARNG